MRDECECRDDRIRHLTSRNEEVRLIQASVGRCRLRVSKPVLKARAVSALEKRLKLKCDESLSNVAFNFNLHHYTSAPPPRAGRENSRGSFAPPPTRSRSPSPTPNNSRIVSRVKPAPQALQAGAYTRPPFGST
jgi:hypothetical protein